MKFHKIVDETTDKRASIPANNEASPRATKLIEYNAEALYKKSRQL